MNLAIVVSWVKVEKLVFIKNHTPTISPIKPCIVKIVKSNEEKLELYIESGLCKISQNESLILTNGVIEKNAINKQDLQVTKDRILSEIETNKNKKDFDSKLDSRLKSDLNKVLLKQELTEN